MLCYCLHSDHSQDLTRMVHL
uniref:Cellulose synthease n=1 Tax=Rhizophora mucronata TaxID=61149 RepID=A0A2P2N0G0_RHIMU